MTNLITSILSTPIPLSFDELTKRMEKCKTPSDLRSLGLPSLSDSSLPYTSKRLYEAIIHPIGSFQNQDNDRTHIKTLITKISELFPSGSKEDEKAKNAFWQLIKQKQTVALKTFQPLTFKANLNTRGACELTLKEMLGYAEQNFIRSEGDRLLYVLNSQANTHSFEETCTTLQHTMNLMILEKEIVAHAKLYFKKLKEIFDLDKVYSKSCHDQEKITLAHDQVAVIFKFPLNHFSSEELAIFINLNQFLTLQMDKEDCYLIFQNRLTLDNAEKLLRKIEQLKSEVKDKKVLFIIDRLFYSVKLFIYSTSCDEHLNTICSLKKTQNRLSIEQLNINLISPSFYYLVAILNKFASSFKKNRILLSDIDPAYFTYAQEIFDFYHKTSGKQASFYDLCLKNLDKTMNLSTKKKKLIPYKKDLTTQSRDSVLPNLPQHLFEQTTNQNTNQNPQVEVSHKEQPQEKLKNQPKCSKEEFVDKPTFENIALSSTKELVGDDLPGIPFNYQYDERVERWHQHPFRSPLPKNIFPEYQDISLRQQTRMHIFHSLHPLVDRFLNLAIQSVWKNKHGNDDTWEITPAEITFENETCRGVITFCTDPKTKICYHKFFTEMRAEKILEGAIKKIFDANDFPDLKLSMQISKNHLALKSKLIEALNASYTIDPIFGNVTIKDHEKMLTIKLFNTSSP